MSNGKALHADWGHTGAVVALDLSPDGKTLATTGLDRTLPLWDPATGKELQRVDLPQAAFALAFSPDGKSLFAPYTDWSIGIWEITQLKEVRRLKPEEDKGEAAILVAHGRRFALRCLLTAS